MEEQQQKICFLIFSLLLIIPSQILECLRSFLPMGRENENTPIPGSLVFRSDVARLF